MFDAFMNIEHLKPSGGIQKKYVLKKSDKSFEYFSNDASTLHGPDNLLPQMSKDISENPLSSSKPEQPYEVKFSLGQIQELKNKYTN